jgi:hypothetical protein
MKTRYAPMMFSLFWLTCMASSLSAPLLAADKPVLSETIQAVIESEGVAAAKSRFAELYPAHKDQYNVDTEGLTELGTGYMNAGDMEKGMAVFEMVSAAALGMASSMSPQAAQSAPQMADFMQQQEAARAEYEKQQETVVEQDQQAKNKTVEQQRGKSRDDLERFTGIYAVPGSKDSNRTIWVMVSCDGYLVAGASWGGASQWWMRSAADRVFTYQDSFQSLSMEFSANGDGYAKGLSHDLDVISSPLERQGPVPDDWGACLERPQR